MAEHSKAKLEERLFEALQDVFEMDDPVALDISKRAVCQIACFIADVGAVSGSKSDIETALGSIEKIQRELSMLSAHLKEYSRAEKSRAIH